MPPLTGRHTPPRALSLLHALEFDMNAHYARGRTRASSSSPGSSRSGLQFRLPCRWPLIHESPPQIIASPKWPRSILLRAWSSTAPAPTSRHYSSGGPARLRESAPSESGWNGRAPLRHRTICASTAASQHGPRYVRSLGEQTKS